MTSPPSTEPAPSVGEGTTGGAHRRWWRALAVVAAVGLAIRVVYVLVVASRLEMQADAAWYFLQAGIIGSGDGFLDPEAYFGRGEAVATANFPPLWPLLLAAVERVGLGTEQTYRMVGATVGTVTVVLTGLVGRRVAGPGVGLVAASIVAASPLLVAADGSLMSESLYGALLMAAVLAAYHMIDRPGLVSMGVVALLGGLAVLTRSDGIVVVPLLVAAAVLSAPGLTNGRRLQLGAVGLVVLVVVVAPWSIRNTVRLERPVPLTSNAGSVLEGANCATTYDGELLGAWDPRCLTETRRADLTEGEWADAGRDKGLAYAREHVGQLPLVAITRLARTFGVWNPVDGARLEAIENRHERWQLAGWFYGIVTLAVAVPGATMLVRRRADVWPLAAVVAGVVVSALLAWGNQRFRLGAEPVIAIGAATAITAWVSRRAPRRPVNPRG